MGVNEKAKISQLYYDNIVEYWIEWIKDRPYDLSITVLIALFPLFCLLIGVCFGVLNPRFDKNHSALYSIAFTTLYFAFAFSLSKSLSHYAMIVVPFIWFLISYFAYFKKIKSLY